MGDRTDIEKLQEMVKLLMDERDAERAACEALGKYCGENHINGRLIPVPRQLSADCGLAWRMEPAEYEQKKEQIHTFGIETDQSVELVI